MIFPRTKWLYLWNLLTTLQQKPILSLSARDESAAGGPWAEQGEA